MIHHKCIYDILYCNLIMIKISSGLGERFVKYIIIYPLCCTPKTLKLIQNNTDCILHLKNKITQNKKYLQNFFLEQICLC